MRVIALDLGSTTGIACGNGPRPDGSEFIKFTGKGGFTPKCFYEFYKYLDYTIATTIRLGEGEIQLVIEKPNAHMPGYAGVKVHFGMLGVALSLEGKYTDLVTSHVVPALTIKKYWTGSGRAKKPDMIAEAQKRGYDIVDDNEADSVALYVYAQEVLFGNK
jgi:hypothetical protein